MSLDLDTLGAALKLERDLALKRSERRALLLEAAKGTEPARAGVLPGMATVRGTRLARALRSLRWVLRPAHA